MEPSTYVASTSAGIAVASRGDDGWTVEVGAEGWALAFGACGGRLFAGMRDGLLRSDDGGSTWTACGLAGQRVSAIGCGPTAVYAGTKGPHLHRSDDGGDTWTELTELHAARRWYWWTPVSKPHQQAEVSSIVVSHSDEGILLVGIEWGAVVRTLDAGRIWEGHGRHALRDCHTLALHPSASGYVYEGGNGGGAYSRDDGATWTRVQRGLGRVRYGWAAAGDAHDPETRYLSAARGVRAAHGSRPHASIFRARGDEPWRPVAEHDAMPYALIPLEDSLVAGLSDGRVLASGDRGESWEELPFRFESIQRTLVVV